MRFDVLTLFPEIFSGYLGQSLLHKAIARRLVEVHLHNFRDWTDDKHHSVDDRPYGGGPGMVIRVEPVVRCVEAVRRLDTDPGRLILLSPRGRRFDQAAAEQLAALPRLILLCGRYEGFDQRVIDILQPEELSIGDFVLNGGEAAAMVVIDTIIRLIPGVLGDEQSARSDSFSDQNRWLEFGQFTRPREFRGHRVPEVLLSGDHGRIARWREEQSYLTTKERRADLLDGPQSESDEPAVPPGKDEEKES